MKNWLLKIFIIVIFLNLAIFVWQNKEKYLEKFDIVKQEEIYKYSQYNVPKNEFRGNIDDPELFSLAGVHYLRGDDPTGINFEQQPLTKYFFGLSILLFGNAAVIQLFLGLATLFILYKLSLSVFNNNILAILPAVLLSFDFLFKEQISRVYLDLFMTLNVLIFFWLFLKSLKNQKLIFLTFIWLGIVGLSKSYFFIPVTFIPVFAHLFLFEKNKLLKYLKQSYWVAISYLAGYLMYFGYHNFPDFINLHVNIVRLYRSYVPEYPKGEIFRIIFTNQWRKWFGDFGLMPANTWSLLWPLGFIFTLFTLFLPRNKTIILLLVWCVVYTGIISTRLVFPRYLLPVLPVVYILLVYCIYGYWHKWQRS